MGGEKAFTAADGAQKKGSPPRGRGKVVSMGPNNIKKGITPAWAGKSGQIDDPSHEHMDHPRVGGEKVRPFLQMIRG